MMRLRRAIAWLLVRFAWLLLIPLLLVLIVFCGAMAVLAEGPLALTVVDWPSCWRRARRAVHVLWAGWEPG